jgi:hypothetical protein
MKSHLCETAAGTARCAVRAASSGATVPPAAPRAETSQRDVPTHFRSIGRASVKADLQFSLATEVDDSGIRRLLRENPMAGRISLSLEREPDYFTDARHTEHQTIVARHQARVVCVGTCSFRQRFVNGEPRRVGYLGGLRLDQSVAGRFDILRRGYRFFREWQHPNPADFYFTAIAADNTRARKFLERDLPGMPSYDYLGDFVTMLIPVPRRRPGQELAPTPAVNSPRPACNGVRPSSGAEMSERPAAREGSHTIAAERVSAPEDGRTPGFGQVGTIIGLLGEHSSRYQFAPCWTAEELRALQSLNLQLEDFRIVRNEGKPVAGAALWDQRSFKQTVIRGYAAPLAWARPWLNFAARLWKQPALPAVGSVLAHAVVSHLAAPADQPETIAMLIHSLFPLARNKGIEWLTLGFAAADPRLAVLRSRFAAREYRSRLYRVRWLDLPGAALDDRLPGPEIALL